MSLILEALRKSEQQRRLGEAPTLGSPPPLMRRRRSVLPWLAALIVVAVGVGWWLSRGPASAPPPAPAVALAADDQADHRPAQPAPPARARPGTQKPLPSPPGDAPDAGLESDIKLIDPGNQADRPGAVLPQTAPTELTRGPRSRPVPEGPSATTPASSAQPNARTREPAPATREPVAPPATPDQAQPAATPSPAQAAPAASPAAPARPAPAPSPATPALPTLWELPYAVRKDIPPIVLTLHVYASDPAARFVVIDGERHAEGDTIVDDLILREIRPEGVVLEFHGQRFTWPRDGR